MTKRRLRPTPERSLAECQRIVNGYVPGDDDAGAGLPRSEHPYAYTDPPPSRGRRTEPQEPKMPETVDDIMNTYLGPRRSAGRGAFASFGEFAKLVKVASNPEPGAEAQRAADRLRNAALTTYSSEGVGADGGFLVPPEFRAELLRKVIGEESLLSRCDQVPTESYAVTVPKDETSPWGGSGIQGFWTGEAGTMTQKKPALEQDTIRLHKLTALVPVTDEMLEDAPAITSYLSTKAADAINFRVTDAIINGTGVGQPLGILNSPHTVSVAKEASQVAATIHGLNLVKMWSRMPASWRREAVWLCHPDAEPQLMQAGLQVVNAAGTVTTGGSLVYIPSGSIEGTPYGALFGRPVIPTQACAALGTVGDLIFASLPQYGAFVRSPGIMADTSIHLWFDQGVTAFRFTLRIGGQPWWSSPIADKNGSGTRSGFVTLATRG